MKKTILALSLLIATLFSAQRACAQEYKYSVGLRLAWFTPGISASTYLNNKAEIEGIFSKGFSNSDNMFTGLYKLHSPLQIEAAKLSWFWGGGAHVGAVVNNGPELGLNATIGLEWVSEDLPLAITVDASPFVNFFNYYGYNPGTANIDLGLGFHYTFK